MALCLIVTVPASSQKFLNKLFKSVDKVLDGVDKALDSVDSALGTKEEEAAQKEGTTTTTTSSATSSTTVPAKGYWATAVEGRKLTYDEWGDCYPPKPRVTANTKTVYLDFDFQFYGDFTDFSDGVAWVRIARNGGYIPIDMEGNKISNYVHSINSNLDPDMPYYHDGVTTVTARVGNKVGYYLMNKKGEFIKEITEFVPSHDKFNNMGLAAGYIMKRKSNHAGNLSAYDLYPVFYNTSGEIVYQASKPMKDGDTLVKAGDFHDGLMVYFDYDVRGWGYMGFDADERLTPWFEPKYHNARDFSDGLAAVRDAAGNWGYIDKSGVEVIPHRFSHEPSAFSCGYALARKRTDDSPFVYIDKTGKIVMEGLHNATPFDTNGYAHTLKMGEGGLVERLINSNFKVMAVLDRQKTPAIYLSGIYYHFDFGRLDPLDNMLGTFVEGVAQVGAGQSPKGYAKPDGEMIIVFAQPEF